MSSPTCADRDRLAQRYVLERAEGFEHTGFTEPSGYCSEQYIEDGTRWDDNASAGLGL